MVDGHFLQSIEAVKVGGKTKPDWKRSQSECANEVGRINGCYK
jgi:hypothetical protein